MSVLHFYDLSGWVGCWSLVYIWMFVYEFLNAFPFDYTGFAVSEKVSIP